MDFLLDPTFFVIFFTVAGGVLINVVEKSKAKTAKGERAKAELRAAKKFGGTIVLPNKGTEVITSKWVCEKYEQHTFEQKLADAGVIRQSEVTLCDNENCELCSPERNRRSEAQRESRRKAMPLKVGKPGTEGDLERFNELKRTDKRYARYRFEDYMFQKQMKENGRAEAARKDPLKVERPWAEQMCEDALRAVRALRFSVTKGFRIDHELAFAMETAAVLDAIENKISDERINDELSKMFRFNTLEALAALNRFPALTRAVFSGRVSLDATMKQKGRGRA